MHSLLRRSTLVAFLILPLSAGCGADHLTSADTSTSSAGDPATNASTSTSTSSTSASTGGGGAGTSSASTGSGDCDLPTPGGPAMAPYSFTLDGQLAWSHDDGFSAGYFHTYDALAVGGPGDEAHKVHVFLPRGYSACSAGYPVVYMNDGNTTFWPGGIGNKSWNVAEALAALYAESAIAPVIVVAIVPNVREKEYTHTAWSPDGPCCGLEQYTGYVADRIRAFVDKNYRTKTGPANTAIIGSSRGGLASFYMANRRPDVFGKAGCLSPSFWAGLDPLYGGNFSGGPLATSLLVETLKPTLANAAARPHLWIDWGLVRTGGFNNYGIEAAATARGKEMVALLETTYAYALDAELFWYEDPMGEHDEISWARRFPMVMKALFGKP